MPKSRTQKTDGTLIQVSLRGLKLSEQEVQAFEKAVRKAVLTELAALDHGDNVSIKNLPEGAAAGQDAVLGRLGGIIRTVGLILSREDPIA